MDLNTLTRLFDGLDSYIIAVDSEFNIKFSVIMLFMDIINHVKTVLLQKTKILQVQKLL